MMINKIKLLISVPLVLLTVIIIYSLLFGKLFPYSPVIIGFSANETDHAVIYIQNGAEFSDSDKIDPLFHDIENFFEMTFKRKPRIFIFRDVKSFCRRSVIKARFCSFYNGDIVIAPWALEEARRGEISLEIYLKHELSHSIIHQQSGLFRASNFPKWLHEGTAMFVAGQRGTTFYPSKEKTRQVIREGNFLHPKDYLTKREKRIKLNVDHRIGFIYSEFACIVDFLIEKYGRERLLLYVGTIIKNGDADRAFQEIYGLEFNECIQAFRESVLQNSD